MDEVADDLRRVANGISREQQRAERVVLQPLPHRLFVEGAVDGDDAADALQREAMPSGIGRKPSAVMKTIKRVAGAAVGQCRGDEAERCQRDALVQRELHDACVELQRGITVKEAAAGQHALGVDGHADAIGQFRHRYRDCRTPGCARACRPARSAPCARRFDRPVPTTGPNLVLSELAASSRYAPVVVAAFHGDAQLHVVDGEGSERLADWNTKRDAGASRFGLRQRRQRRRGDGPARRRQRRGCGRRCSCRTDGWHLSLEKRAARAAHADGAVDEDA